MTPEVQTRCHLAFLLQRQAEKYGDKTAVSYQPFGSDVWQHLSWKAFADKARKVSRAMLSLGLSVHENIGIFASNSLEFALTDFGAWGIRVTTVPIFATSSAEQLRTIVNDARIRVLFVGDQQQYELAFQLLKTSETLEKIVIFDPRVSLSEHDGLSLYWQQFVLLADSKDAETELAQRLKDATDDDLMSIIYTSGTL